MGQPQPVRLEAHQKVELDIIAPLSLDHLFVEVEVLLGEAKIDLKRFDDLTIWQYGEDSKEKNIQREDNLIKFNVTVDEFTKNQTKLSFAFKLII